MRNGKRFAIVLTERAWWSEALKGRIRIFHFPPNRMPRVGGLKEGDVCVVYLLDGKCFVGEFAVKEVRHVDADEFERYKNLAYELPKAPFPKGDQKSWIIVFNNLKPYGVEVRKRDVDLLADCLFVVLSI